jgi:molybdate transport system ATP-binding protein
VGIVFQHYALFPHLTALENVMEALLDYPARERCQRAEAWLSRVHLGGLEARKPAALSGGQQQRVAVARALAREPEVLLLDEPFTSVDRATRERLYQEFAELRRDLQMPVVLVTHDLEEAVMLADRLTILAHGRTLQTGTPVEVMTRPDTVEVARLVGLKNIFEAKVITHCLEHQHTRIAWRGRELIATLQPRFTPGAAVAWTIPTSHVLLHRSPRSSHGERENPLIGTVAEYLPLGERVAAFIHVDGRADTWLATTIPLHKARRQGLAPGVSVSIALLAEGIHLMPLPESSVSGEHV